jgi:non-ribosomal peptide synthetase component F
VLFDLQTFGNDLSDPNAPLFLFGKGWELGSAAKHDLGVFVHDSPSGLDIFINYATTLFRQETIVALGATFTELLRQFAALSPNTPTSRRLQVSELRLLNPEQHHRVVRETNVRRCLNESEDTICGGFERQAQQNPEAIAVVTANSVLTYRALNNRGLRRLRGRTWRTR